MEAKKLKANQGVKKMKQSKKQKKKTQMNQVILRRNQLCQMYQ